MSACFEHFLKMSEISNSCRQFLFTTHWYGFLPIIEKGNVISITKKTGKHNFDNITLENYRELVKQQIKNSRGSLPHDIRLKSMNDFIQSIISSVLDDEPFNWIICEGSSEKIYFDHYLKNLKENNKLRIIPVGGASEVKRIYENLMVSIDEFKKEINGKVYFLIDTDAELLQFETKDHTNILCRRMVNVGNETKLVKITANPKAPPTEIEDALNGKAFYETLKKFKPDYQTELAFVEDDKEIDEIPSFFGLDLRPSEQTLLTQFFDSGNNKI